MPDERENRVHAHNRRENIWQRCVDTHRSRQSKADEKMKTIQQEKLGCER